MIGTFLARQGRSRNELFSIATKAAITKDPETGARTFNNSAEHLESELDDSLARLGVDHVDLFYVHRRDPSIPIEEVTETLVGLIKKGKIRSFGYSEIAPTSLRRANAIHHVAAVQSEYSLAVRFPELGLVQSTAELGTALVAFSPCRKVPADRPAMFTGKGGNTGIPENQSTLSGTEPDSQYRGDAEIPRNGC